MNAHAQQSQKAKRAALPAALQSKFLTLQQLFTDGDVAEAWTRYKIGTVVAEVMASEKTYGEKAVETLADALNRHKSVLYRTAEVARMWPEQDMVALLARRGHKGQIVTWSHLVELERVKLKDRRQSLVDEILTKGLSVRELRALLPQKSRRTVSSAPTASVAPPAPPIPWPSPGQPALPGHTGAAIVPSDRCNLQDLTGLMNNLASQATTWDQQRVRQAMTSGPSTTGEQAHQHAAARAAALRLKAVAESILTVLSEGSPGTVVTSQQLTRE